MLSKTLGQEGYNMSLNQEEEEYIERLYRVIYLINQGVESALAFTIMESVRKGKVHHTDKLGSVMLGIFCNGFQHF